MRYAALIERTFQVVHTSGEEFQCMCPWHQDTSGHLYVNAVKGLYFCQSCGAKGSILNGKDGKAVRLPPAGMDDVRKRIERFRQPADQQQYRDERWLRQFDSPTDFWTGRRGLSEATVSLFRLGYDPFSRRATLPLRDARGRILGVTYRRLDDGTPRYLHPKKFPIGRHLYGAWLIEDQRTIAITEGQVDAISGWESRVPAVATMGARITKDQVKVLQRLGVRKAVFLYDNDNAGRKGTVAAYEMLRGSGIQFAAGWYRSYWTIYDPKIEAMRPVKDPDELTPARYRKMFHSALPILDWIERSGFSPS